MNPLRVLIVEDSEDDTLLMVRELRKGGYEPEYERVETAGAMQTALREKGWDVILCDYRLPQFDGPAAIALLKETGIDIPLIIVSGAIGEETASDCMRYGAQDYVSKGKLSRLVPAIEREMKEAESRVRRRQAEEVLMVRERSYRTLAENLPGIVYRVHTREKGRMQFFNNMLATLTGYDENELMEGEVCSIEPLIVAEDREKIVAEVKAAIEEARSFYLEYRITHKDGTPRFFIERGRPIFDDDGLQCIDGIIQDVTVRKLAEHDAMRAREDWENIFQAISHPTVILDPRHGIIAANKAVLCAAGLSRGEILGKKCYEVFHGKDAVSPTDGCPMESLLASGRSETVTREIEAFGGAFLVSCTPIRNQQGSVEKIIHITTDITDLKRAEEALRSSERRLSDIIEFLPDATLAIDMEGKVIAWNRAMEEMTRIRAEEMLGKGDYEYALPFYGERRPIFIDLALHPQLERDEWYRNIQKRGDILFGETDPSHLPGGINHLSVTASVLRNPEGEIVAAIECVRDDTGRRQAQEELCQAEQRYRSIFENAQDGIYRSTPEGRIITANPAMARMLGYASPEELMAGITDAARQLYVDPEERARIRKIIEESGPAINREVQVYRKDGSIIWISLTIQAVRDEKGRILHYEGMADDITERKQSFERLRKTLGATIQAIASTVETRDPYTAGHQRRVADLARNIAMEMKLPADQVDGIRMAAVIHDLGKISVPAEILSKPTKISTLEFGLIKTHAQSGYDILKDIDFPWPIARIVLEHHERMDGSGYPNGLVAEEILLESRIIAVADVVESIASHRPYRPALGIDAAMEEIGKNRGTLYDADAVDACLSIFQEKRYQLSS